MHGKVTYWLAVNHALCSYEPHPSTFHSFNKLILNRSVKRKQYCTLKYWQFRVTCRLYSLKHCTFKQHFYSFVFLYACETFLYECCWSANTLSQIFAVIEENETISIVKNVSFISVVESELM